MRLFDDENRIPQVGEYVRWVENNPLYEKPFFSPCVVDNVMVEDGSNKIFVIYHSWYEEKLPDERKSPTHWCWLDVFNNYTESSSKEEFDNRINEYYKNKNKEYNESGKYRESHNKAAREWARRQDPAVKVAKAEKMKEDYQKNKDYIKAKNKYKSIPNERNKEEMENQAKRLGITQYKKTSA